MAGSLKEYRPGQWRIRMSWKGKRIEIYTIEIRGVWHKLSGNTGRYLLDHLSKVYDDPGFDLNDYLQKKDHPFQFKEACDLWIDNSNCSQEWLEAREKIAEKYLKPYFIDFDIRDIKKIHLEGFVKYLRGHDLKDKTIHNYLGEVKAMLNFHAESLPRIPVFPKVPYQEPTIRWMTAEQQDHVFEFIPGRDLPIFTFLRYTGCRPNEAGGLLRENVYRDKGIVVLETVLGGMGQLKPNTKTRKSKPLPIIPEIEWALTPKRLGKYVFQTVTGRPYRKRRLEDIWDEACKRALDTYNVPRVPLYQGLKHSFGCQRLASGFTLDQIAAVMGHTDTRTTKKYAKFEVANLAKVMKG
jgi:integrase